MQPPRICSCGTVGAAATDQFVAQLRTTRRAPRTHAAPKTLTRLGPPPLTPRAPTRPRSSTGWREPCRAAPSMSATSRGSTTLSCCGALCCQTAPRCARRCRGAPRATASSATCCATAAACSRCGGSCPSACCPSAGCPSAGCPSLCCLTAVQGPAHCCSLQLASSPSRFAVEAFARALVPAGS